MKPALSISPPHKTMLRFLIKSHRTPLRLPLRYLSSSPPPPNPSQYPNNVKNPQSVAPSLDSPHSPIIRQSDLLLSLSFLSPKPLFSVASATLVSAIAAFAFFSDSERPVSGSLYGKLEHSVENTKESVKRIVDRMKQTGVAAAVLLKYLRSVLSSANQEVRSGFELRVASLLADIVAANESRRLTIVRAGGGAVVDWLLETVAYS